MAMSGRLGGETNPGRGRAGEDSDPSFPEPPPLDRSIDVGRLVPVSGGDMIAPDPPQRALPQSAQA